MLSWDPVVNITGKTFIINSHNMIFLTPVEAIVQLQSAFSKYVTDVNSEPVSSDADCGSLNRWQSFSSPTNMAALHALSIVHNVAQYESKALAI